MKNTLVIGIVSLIIISGLAILWAVEGAKPSVPAQEGSHVSSVSSGFGMKLLPTEISTTTVISTPSVPEVSTPATTTPPLATTTPAISILPAQQKTTTTVKTAEELRAVSFDQLLAMAGDTYASGELPLGDNKYVTSAPKKGYIYLCNAHSDNFGAQANGSWIHGSTWNILEKTAVEGSVSWPTATFAEKLMGSLRELSGNGLPVGHTTGNFPIASTDPAYQVDRNPNSIKTHTLSVNIAANPVYSDTPTCTGGGEVGVMLTGVPLFNGFDAGLRDAAAHEMQDSCSGHPQESGEYHYHSMSNCFKDKSITTILGYALDGFPITGPTVAKNKYLTTADLDVCHGITSNVMKDGKSVLTYHYVMTEDFPYSISCFRGKPVTVSPGSAAGGSKTTQGAASSGGGQTPPQEAISACTGKTTGASCSFTSQRGDSISGTCGTPPNSSLACMPAGGPPH